jgi:hypothetical protein
VPRGFQREAASGEGDTYRVWQGDVEGDKAHA